MQLYTNTGPEDWSSYLIFMPVSSPKEKISKVVQFVRLVYYVGNDGKLCTLDFGYVQRCKGACRAFHEAEAPTNGPS